MASRNKDSKCFIFVILFFHSVRCHSSSWKSSLRRVVKKKKIKTLVGLDLCHACVVESETKIAESIGSLC